MGPATGQHLQQRGLRRGRSARRLARQRSQQRRAHASTYPYLPTVIACVVVLLGPGSAAMHATQSALGGHLDMLSMYLIASFAAAYALMRWRRGGPRLLAAGFLGGVALCELVGLWHAPIPVVMHAGNAAFGLLLIVAIVLEVRIMRRGESLIRRSYVYVSLGALVTAFAIWNASKTWLCDPHSLVQGHAIWHLLCAVAAYFLYRYYASEDSRLTATKIHQTVKLQPAPGP